MIDDFLTLLEKLARGHITTAEREELRNQFVRMMMPKDSYLDSLYNPTTIGSNADKLDNQDGSYYQNASNINAGTLHTDRYSAYNDLVAESKIGVGTSQVSQGDHNHGGNLSGNITFTVDGALATYTGIRKFVLPYAGTIHSVYITVDENGTANTTILDVNLNGTTIFTTQANRPDIAHDDADNIGSGTPDVTSFNAGDVLEFDIDAVATGAVTLGVGVYMTYEFTDPPQTQYAIFTVDGELRQDKLKHAITNLSGKTWTIQKVHLRVANAPSGAAAIIDIHKDGTTIFTTQSNRPQINAGDFTGISATVENDQWADGEILECWVDQTGSASKGWYLTVTVVFI